MKKKLMAMMMCLTLTVGTFAGCAGGETKEAEDSKTEEMSDKDSEQEVSKDTITIIIFSNNHIFNSAFFLKFYFGLNDFIIFFIQVKHKR